MQRLNQEVEQCKNGPCPAIHTYTPQPEMLAVQGPTLTDQTALDEIDVPGHESLVLVPRELVEEYARKLLAEKGS